MPIYDVFVTWKETVGHHHFVEASSPEEAKKLAIEECGNRDCDSDYEIVETTNEFEAEINKDERGTRLEPRDAWSD